MNEAAGRYAWPFFFAIAGVYRIVARRAGDISCRLHDLVAVRIPVATSHAVLTSSWLPPVATDLR